MIQIYFSQLELARDLGWVRSEEEGAALKDAHLQDLSFQQAEGAEGDSQVCIGFAVFAIGLRFSLNHLYLHYPQSGNPLRKSQEGKNKGSGGSRSAPGPLRTSGEGSLGGAAKAAKVRPRVSTIVQYVHFP